MLVFIGGAVHSDSPDFSSAILLALFGLVLSVIGFLITVALTLGHLNHKLNVMMILYSWSKTEFYIDPKKPVPYKTVHRWFFEITIALFASLLLFYSFKSWTYSTDREQTVLFILATVIIFGAIFGVISYAIDALYKDRWRKYSRERVIFLKALRNDTERHYEGEWPNLFKPPKSLKELVKYAVDKGILKPDEKP